MNILIRIKQRYRRSIQNARVKKNGTLLTIKDGEAVYSKLVFKVFPDD